jgi:hypothetical protein
MLLLGSNLNVLVIEALNYSLYSKFNLGLIRGISLPKVDIDQLVNGDLLMILKEQTYLVKTMEYLDTFYVASDLYTLTKESM